MPPKTDMKILVVDDFVTMRRIIRNILRQLGYEDVDEAENGEAAFSKIKVGQYDFLITDWNMPTMSGLDLVKAVRANEDTKQLPILMVTAEALKQNIIDAVKAGVNNYVVKPFTPEVLKEKIDKIFE
ncbi:chemotaxis protein CheY [bacterium]|nr:chemotaxis protein CheY [bacterium]